MSTASGAHILILNHNGKALLDECLPSVVRAARTARTRCRVTVIDNGSTDGSACHVRRGWPNVALRCVPNRGLISFNDAVREVSEPYVLLLNNDVKLADGCVDHLVSALHRDPNCFLAGPLCWDFRGRYEGTRSALCFRRGLVHTRLIAGAINEESYTASAGAVMAVRRDKFLALGGFDPLFLPGRYEDLDLSFRAWLAGWSAVYVPEALAYHKSRVTFGAMLSREANLALDARNSILFAWKNLHEIRHLALHVFFLMIRLVWAVLSNQREFLHGWAAAVRKIPEVWARRTVVPRRARSERELFCLLSSLDKSIGFDKALT